MEDEACLDVSVQGFWGNHYQRNFFDVRVFNPTALSYHSTAVSSLYRQFEREKQQMCGQRVRDVEIGSFAPLVFSTFWGMGGSGTTVFKRLASLIAAQHDQPYSSVMACIRCSISSVTCCMECSLIMAAQCLLELFTL